MSKSGLKKNIEWLIEQYKKIRPKPYVGLLVVAGISLLVGPDWWQNLVASFSEDLYAKYMNSDYVKQQGAVTSIWVGFGLIFIGLIWHVTLQTLDSRVHNKSNVDIADKLHEKMKAKEQESWQPVLIKIIELIEKIEGWLYIGYKAFSSPSQENYNLATHSRQRVIEHKEKLEQLVSDLNTDVKPALIQLLSVIELLISKFEFINLVYTDKTQKTDFILSTPMNELEILTDEFKRIAKDVGYIIEEKGKDPNLRIDTHNAWMSFVENNAVYDIPNKYEASKERCIYAFNVEVMTQLGGVKPGMQVQCFIGN